MKKIIGIAATLCIATIGLTACGQSVKEPVETQTTESIKDITDSTSITTTNTEASTENTEISTENESTVETTTIDAEKEAHKDPTVDVPQDKPEEYIHNGSDDTVKAKVGDYISLTEATGGGYEVGNIEILSGDSVSVMGRDSVIAEKTGRTLVKCALFDDETNSKTETEIEIIVE